MTGVYLATAIDQATGQDSARLDLRNWLSNTEGVSWVYDPKDAFRVGYSEDLGSGIREINAAALANCDVLLAYLPKDTVSVGVPMEVERALSLGLHVVVVSDAPSWMLQDERIHRFYEWAVPARAWLREFLRETPKRRQGRTQQDPMPVLLQKGAVLPTRGHADDAGLDLHVSEDVLVPPGAFRDVPCGVHAQLPDWSWGMITGRSSTLRKRGLLVNQGVIDAGYRGELFAGVFNLSGEEVLVRKGERVAQLILIENGTARVYPEEKWALTAGSRGHEGFGSTGL